MPNDNAHTRINEREQQEESRRRAEQYRQQAAAANDNNTNTTRATPVGGNRRRQWTPEDTAAMQKVKTKHNKAVSNAKGAVDKGIEWLGKMGNLLLEGLAANQVAEERSNKLQMDALGLDTTGYDIPESDEYAETLQSAGKALGNSAVTGVIGELGNRAEGAVDFAKLPAYLAGIDIDSRAEWWDGVHSHRPSLGVAAMNAYQNLWTDEGRENWKTAVDESQFFNILGEVGGELQNWSNTYAKKAAEGIDELPEDVQGLVERGSSILQNTAGNYSRALDPMVQSIGYLFGNGAAQVASLSMMAMSAMSSGKQQAMERGLDEDAAGVVGLANAANEVLQESIFSMFRIPAGKYGQGANATIGTSELWDRWIATMPTESQRLIGHYLGGVVDECAQEVFGTLVDAGIDYAAYGDEKTLGELGNDMAQTMVDTALSTILLTVLQGDMSASSQARILKEYDEQLKESGLTDEQIEAMRRGAARSISNITGIDSQQIIDDLNRQLAAATDIDEQDIERMEMLETPTPEQQAVLDVNEEQKASQERAIAAATQEAAAESVPGVVGFQVITQPTDTAEAQAVMAQQAQTTEALKQAMVQSGIERQQKNDAVLPVQDGEGQFVVPDTTVQQGAMEQQAPQQPSGQVVYSYNDKSGSRQNVYGYTGRLRRQHNEVLKVADALGRKVVFTEALPGGSSAFYDSNGKTIYIDGRTRNPQSTFFFHELTHNIADETGRGEAWKEFRQYAVEAAQRAYGDEWKGYLQGLIQDYAELYDTSNGEEFSEKISEEIAAEYVQKYLFKDENAVKDLLNRNGKWYQKVWQQIKDFIRGMGDDVNKDFLRAEQLFSKVYAEAQENLKAGDPMSPRQEAWFSRKYEEQMADASEKKNNESGYRHVPADLMHTANLQMEQVKTLMDRDDISAALPADTTEGNNGKNTEFGNASYGISEENTTVCVRQICNDIVCDAVAETIGRPLNVMESLWVSQQFMGYADKGACLYCYELMDRWAKSEYINQYLANRDKVVAELRSGRDADAVWKEYIGKRKPTDTQKARFDMFERIANGEIERVISPADMANQRTIDQTLDAHPELADQIKDCLAWAQASSQAKKKVAYTAYDGHILKWSADKVGKLNAAFGLRFYSFSDFSPAFILENMQMVRDAAVQALKGLAYTKETDFVKIFAPTGMNINMSIFGYTNERGETVEDSMQGAKWEDVKRMREKFPNVGSVFVATSDAQVEWALAQDWIDVVIPFHTVRSGKDVADALGYKIFTGQQKDRKADGWEKGRDLEEIPPALHNNDKELYFSLLEQNHLTPRFADWVDNPGYMKLVNETRQSYGKTEAMQPVFDISEVEDMLNKFVAKGGYENEAYGSTRYPLSKVAQRIADDFVKNIDNIEQQVRRTPAFRDVVDEVTGKAKESPLFAREEEYRKRVLAQKDNIMSQFGINKLGDYVQVQKKVNDYLRSSGFFTNADGKSRTDINADSGMEVVTNRSGVNETFNSSNYAKRSQFIKLMKLLTMPRVAEVIRNGELVADDVENEHGNPDLKYAYIVGDTEILGTPITMRVAVRKSQGRNKFWVHYIDFQNKENTNGITSARADAVAAFNTIGVEDDNNTSPAESQAENGAQDDNSTPLFARGERLSDDFVDSEGYPLTIKNLVERYQYAVGKEYVMPKTPRDLDNEIDWYFRQAEENGIELDDKEVSELLNIWNDVAQMQENDRRYEEAYESNNDEEAAELVKQAAAAAGYTQKLYSGTEAFGFTQIDPNEADDGFSFWATSSEKVAETYTRGKKRRINYRYTETDVAEAYDKAMSDLEDEVYRFCSLVSKYFSEWAIGQGGEVDVLGNVMNANPIAGYGDGVYDYLEEIIYDAYHYYGDEAREQYGEFDIWQDESDAATELYNAVDSIEALYRKLDGIGDLDESGVYELYANTKNLLEYDGNGSVWNSLTPTAEMQWSAYTPSYLFNKMRWKTRDVVDWAALVGYDGVHFKNIIDDGGYGTSNEVGDAYAFFDANAQVKSADTYTFDDNGNLIPLSERFNDNSVDLRWARGEKRELAQPQHLKDTLNDMAESYDGNRGEFRTPSRVGWNTLSRTPIYDTAEKNMLGVMDGDKLRDYYGYAAESEIESLHNARERTNTPEKVAKEERGLPHKFWNGEDTDTAMVILSKKLDEARESGDYKAVRHWAKMIQRRGTEAGQRIQAFAKYTATPEGMLVKAGRVLEEATKYWQERHPKQTELVKRLANELMEGFEGADWKFNNMTNIENGDVYRRIHEVIKRLAKENGIKINDPEAAAKQIAELVMKEKGDERREELLDNLMNLAANGTIGLTDEEMDKVYDLFEEASQFAPTSKEAFELESQAYQIFADHLNTSWSDKWNAWRYLAMLGNTRTHIKNMVGNAMFGGVTQIKDALAGIIEQAAGVENRTKTANLAWRNTEKGKKLYNAAKADADHIYTILRGKSKYNVEQSIDAQKRIFKTDWLEKARKFNDFALEQEDWWALRKAYARSLANYMYTNNLTEADLQNDSEQANRARAIAVKEAQKATFRNANAVAQALSNLSDNLNNADNAAVRALGKAVEGVIPFKNTPANIVARGIEYSPAGLISTISKAADHAKTGYTTGAEVADSLASTLTGTGVVALGVFLASLGALTGGDDDDDRVQKWRESTGQQNYALNIGDKSYTLDWAAPAALPLMVGAELYNALEGKGIDANGIVTAIASAANPAVEMTMLQGVKNIIDSASYGDSTLGSLAWEAGTSYLTQAIPTLSGQLARSIDDTRRTAAPDDTGFKGDLQYLWNKQMTKTPGLSKTVEPYIDVWGREDKNEGGSFFGRLLYNTLSPGYASRTEMTAADEFVESVYNATGDSKALPQKPSRTVNKQRLDAETYTKYARIMGQTSLDMVTELSSVKGLDNTQKLAMLDSIYKYAGYKAQVAVGVGSETAKKSVDKYAALEKQGVSPFDYMLTDIEYGNGNGSLTQEEIYTSGLSEREKRMLWDASGWATPYDKYKPKSSS